MKLNKLAVTLIMAMGVTAGVANAAGTPGGTGKVNFKGQIVDAPCSIAADSTNQEKEMGAITVKTLEAGRSANVPFELHLESCDVTTAHKAGIIFDGVRAESGNESLLMLNGTAKGAGLGIVNKNGDDITLSQEQDMGEVLQGDNTLNFTAYLEKVGSASIVPGNFTSVANFTMTYQ